MEINLCFQNQEEQLYIFHSYDVGLNIRCASGEIYVQLVGFMGGVDPRLTILLPVDELKSQFWIRIS